MIFSTTAAQAIGLLLRVCGAESDDQRITLDELLVNVPIRRHIAARICQRLAARGLLDSARGRHGGFRIGKPAEQIHLAEIVSVFDPIERLERCVIGFASCDEHQPCPHHEHWQPVRDDLLHFLRSTTLADIAITPTCWDRRIQAIASPNSGGTGGIGRNSGSRVVVTPRWSTQVESRSPARPGSPAGLK